ncbi:MAG: histidine--tRNA ligase [Thermodesulfobacteriota bacterium]
MESISGMRDRRSETGTDTCTASLDISCPVSKNQKGELDPLEFTAIKGFKDILPSEVEPWQRLEAAAREIFAAFNFSEIKPPAMEWTELFSRSIGQDTDIVSKEMYTIHDSKGRGMTLRPEATASITRAYIQNRLYQENPVQKLFVTGPMFRHENPQKGRFRQFHQIDAEIFGDPGPLSDADLIVMLLHLFESLSISGLTLHLNSLGCPVCRTGFRSALRDYLEHRSQGLCADCTRRAGTNPLRVFDCKVEGCRDLVEGAPSVLDYLCGDCRGHFDRLQGLLAEAGVSYVVNPRLVRGLDYYTRTAFEVQTERLGAQNAVAGGGRYDGLIKELGGPDHPAIGFAVGVERLIALMHDNRAPEEQTPALFVAALGEEASRRAFAWVTGLRKAGLRVEMDYASRSLKSQMKRADRIGARRVLIVGEDELASGRGLLRDMETKAQEEIPLEGLIERLSRLVKSS